MKIEIITYEPMTRRLLTIKRVLSELSARGLSVQLVHPSEKTVRALQEQVDVNVFSTHTLRYTPVEADCVVLVDADIVDKQTVSRLEALGKDVYVLVPQGAFPGLPGKTLSDIRTGGELFPYWSADDTDYPRTFACHHVAETCMNCEYLVTRWKSDRRDSAERNTQPESN
jgi:hypothetical protein